MLRTLNQNQFQLSSDADFVKIPVLLEPGERLSIKVENQGYSIFVATLIDDDQQPLQPQMLVNDDPEVTFYFVNNTDRAIHQMIIGGVVSLDIEGRAVITMDIGAS